MNAVKPLFLGIWEETSNNEEKTDESNQMGKEVQL